MSFAINNKLSFIDSFQFLNSSLDSLVKRLKNYLSEKIDNNVLDLVKQKEFCPFEYMIKKISVKEYEHVLNVWEKFEMKNGERLSRLSLICDFLLLADAFEKFRKNSLKNYGLSPSHYLSALGLRWDAMLKMTKIKIELVSDPDMYIFFEKGTRCGIFYISNWYSKANNKYLKSYDPKQEWNILYT